MARSWFRELYGFDERGSFEDTRAMFHMEGDELICPTSPFPRQFVGSFETPSVAELRQHLEDFSSTAGSLRFQHLATPTGIQSIILDPVNAGAVFQAASQ